MPSVIVLFYKYRWLFLPDKAPEYLVQYKPHFTRHTLVHPSTTARIPRWVPYDTRCLTACGSQTSRSGRATATQCLQPCYQHQHSARPTSFTVTEYKCLICNFDTAFKAQSHKQGGDSFCNTVLYSWRHFRHRHTRHKHNISLFSFLATMECSFAEKGKKLASLGVCD
jgi:hypothetical protein